MLSKKAIRFLNDNGYEFKEKNDEITIKNSGTDRTIVIGCKTVILGFITIITVNNFIFVKSITSALTDGIIGVIIFGIVYKIFSIFIKKMNKSSELTIYPHRNFLEIGDSNMLNRIHFTDIEELNYHSKFVSEYAAAHKKTSQEFKQTIHLKIANGRNIELFKFKGDYLEPSEEFMEVHDLLKNTFKC